MPLFRHSSGPSVTPAALILQPTIHHLRNTMPSILKFMTHNVTARRRRRWDVILSLREMILYARWLIPDCACCLETIPTSDTLLRRGVRRIVYIGKRKKPLIMLYKKMYVKNIKKAGFLKSFKDFFMTQIITFQIKCSIIKTQITFWVHTKPCIVRWKKV